MEAVAAARRELPPGGEVPEDYIFQGEGADGEPADVRLSELFAPGKDSLAIYSFMFPRDPEDERPGRSGAGDGKAAPGRGAMPVVRRAARPARRHGRARRPDDEFAVVAKSPLPRVLDLGAGAGLAPAAAALLGRQHLQPRLPRGDPEGAQRPMLNVFHRDGDDDPALLGLGALLRATGIPARTRATWDRSSRSGTSSTSPRKGGPIGTSS